MTHAGTSAAVQEGLALDEVARHIADTYGEVAPVRSWGETSFFYNPSGALPRGVYFCTLKDHDGQNDQSSQLDRPGVYRLSFGVPTMTYARLFGPRPSRPAKGRIVDGPWDFMTLDHLTPHPVYAWIGWLCILNPTPTTFDQVQPLLRESHGKAARAYARRRRR